MKIGDTVTYNPPKLSRLSGKEAVIRSIDWSYDPTAEIEFIGMRGLMKAYISHLVNKLEIN